MDKHRWSLEIRSIFFIATRSGLTLLNILNDKNNVWLKGNILQLVSMKVFRKLLTFKWSSQWQHYNTLSPQKTGHHKKKKVGHEYLKKKKDNNKKRWVLYIKKWKRMNLYFTICHCSTSSGKQNSNNTSLYLRYWHLWVLGHFML